MDPKINKPCHADWNEITGDQKSRHCDKCNKSVHNISEMSKEEAEQLLCQSSESVCIRIQQASNGSFKTQSGWMKRMAIAGAATLTLIPMTACSPKAEVLTGDPSVPYSQPETPIQEEPLPEQGAPVTGKIAVPDPETNMTIMGDYAPTQEMGEIKASIPPQPTMGSVAPTSKDTPQTKNGQATSTKSK